MQLKAWSLTSLVAITSTLATALAAVPAPATRPAPGPSLEVRAAIAFNNGQYALALPLLQKLETRFQAEPQRLGAVQEQIRVCQTQVAQAAQKNNTTPAQILAAVAPPPSAESRKPHAPPKPGVIADMDIKELGNFEYDAEKGGNIPADVLALSGSKLRLRGFMIPVDQAENITQFALVPSLFACCFGQPPQIQHTIVCKAPPGKAVGYYPDEIQVEGTLIVKEEKDDGFIVSVFELDASSVKPVAK
jgi:hypothetical protein